MSGEWSPLDDVGRSEAAILHGLRRVAAGHRRLSVARADAVAGLDRLLAVIASGEVDWTESTEEEAREYAATLDVIHGVRDQLGAAPFRQTNRQTGDVEPDENGDT